jgi:hypothetical protein
MPRRSAKSPVAVAPPEVDIAGAILIARGQKVILDSDLARLYGVTTKRMNEQVKRNSARFPPDFLFRLSARETADLNRSQNATGSQKHRDPKFPPFAFSEHGAVMAAMVLSTVLAVAMSVHVVRAFVRLRGAVAANTALAQKLRELEQRVDGQDEDIADILAAIRELMRQPEPNRRGIGFLADHS